MGGKTTVPVAEPHYGAVLNFFYFLLLDEGLALNAAYKTTKAAKRKLVDVPPRDFDAHLISMMSDIFQKYQKRHGTLQSVSRPAPSLGAGATHGGSDWETPNREFLGAWKDYMRRATDDSPETLVLYYILKYPVATIARGLGLPEGTIYFRIGRGLESFAK